MVQTKIDSLRMGKDRMARRCLCWQLSFNRTRGRPRVGLAALYLGGYAWLRKAGRLPVPKVLEGKYIYAGNLCKRSLRKSKVKVGWLRVELNKWPIFFINIM